MVRWLLRAHARGSDCFARSCASENGPSWLKTDDAFTTSACRDRTMGCSSVPAGVATNANCSRVSLPVWDRSYGLGLGHGILLILEGAPAGWRRFNC